MNDYENLEARIKTIEALLKIKEPKWLKLQTWLNLRNEFYHVDSTIIQLNDDWYIKFRLPESNCPPTGSIWETILLLSQMHKQFDIKGVCPVYSPDCDFRYQYVRII